MLLSLYLQYGPRKKQGSAFVLGQSWIVLDTSLSCDKYIHNAAFSIIYLKIKIKRLGTPPIGVLLFCLLTCSSSFQTLLPLHCRPFSFLGSRNHDQEGHRVDTLLSHYTPTPSCLSTVSHTLCPPVAITSDLGLITGENREGTMTE